MDKNIKEMLEKITTLNEEKISEYTKLFDSTDIKKEINKKVANVEKFKKYDLYDYILELDNITITFFYLCYYKEKISEKCNEYYSHAKRNFIYLKLYNYFLYILHNSVFAIFDRSYKTVCKIDNIIIFDEKRIYNSIKKEWKKSVEKEQINYLKFINKYSNSKLEKIKEKYRNQYNHNLPKRLLKFGKINGQIKIIDNIISPEESFNDTIELLNEMKSYLKFFLDVLKN